MLKRWTTASLVMAILMALTPARSYAAVNDVVIDGAFADWSDELALLDEGNIDDNTPDKSDLTYAGVASNYHSSQPANTVYFLFKLDPVLTDLPGSGAAVVINIDTDSNSTFDYELRINVTKENSDTTIYNCGSNVVLRNLAPGTEVTWNGLCRKKTDSAAFALDPDSDTTLEISLPLTNLGLSAGAAILMNVDTRQSGFGQASPDDTIPHDPTQRLRVDTGNGVNTKSGPNWIRLGTFSARSGQGAAIAPGVLIGGLVLLLSWVVRRRGAGHHAAA